MKSNFQKHDVTKAATITFILSRIQVPNGIVQGVLRKFLRGKDRELAIGLAAT